jgi:hypothetical protein
MVHTRPSPVTVNALEAGIPAGRNRRQAIKNQREQGTRPDVRRHAILVVTDDRPLPAPGQVAAPDAARHRAEVAADVQQRDIVERQRRPVGERRQLGPDLGETLGGGPAHSRQPVASRRPGGVSAQPRQQRPRLRERGQVGPGVLAERPESLTAGTT